MIYDRLIAEFHDGNAVIRVLRSSTGHGHIIMELDDGVCVGHTYWQNSTDEFAIADAAQGVRVL